jgi:hypothetical protein
MSSITEVNVVECVTLMAIVNVGMCSVSPPEMD